MIRILVNDVAASQGGALAILKSFYQYVIDTRERYPEIEWFFLVSGDYIAQTDRVNVIINTDAKKSWFSRLRFDRKGIKQILHAVQPDIIFSLQNLTLHGVPIPQAVYIHQSIPFQDKKKFSFLKKEEFILAVYQKVIGRMILKSANRAELAIVQTKWMKEALQNKAKTDPAKILVAFPDIADCGKRVDQEHFDQTRFFYPAFESIYKNQACIYQACTLLNSRGIGDFEVELTFSSSDKRPNIKFCGPLSFPEVLHRYQTTTLLFPSYIETVGLPLAEARQVGTLILASNCAFAREVLNGYPNAYFFDPFRPDELAQLMQRVLEGKITRETGIQSAKTECQWEAVVNRLLSLKR